MFMNIMSALALSGYSKTAAVMELTTKNHRNLENGNHV